MTKSSNIWGSRGPIGSKLNRIPLHAKCNKIINISPKIFNYLSSQISGTMQKQLSKFRLPCYIMNSPIVNVNIFKFKWPSAIGSLAVLSQPSYLFFGTLCIPLFSSRINVKIKNSNNSFCAARNFASTLPYSGILKVNDFTSSYYFMQYLTEKRFLLSSKTKQNKMIDLPVWGKFITLRNCLTLLYGRISRETNVNESK